MAKKNNDGYLSARESRRITRENRKITNVYEKQRKRKNVPESEYLTVMNDPGNSLEIENLGDCILNGAAPFVSQDFSIKNAKFFDAVFKEIGW